MYDVDRELVGLQRLHPGKRVGRPANHRPVHVSSSAARPLLAVPAGPGCGLEVSE